MAPAAMLKEPEYRKSSVHAQRIDDGNWAVVSDRLRRELIKGGAFSVREANAIADAMVEVARAMGTLEVDSLAARLHSKAFAKDQAKTLAAAIVSAYD